MSDLATRLAAMAMSAEQSAKAKIQRYHTPAVYKPIATIAHTMAAFASEGYGTVIPAVFMDSIPLQREGENRKGKHMARQAVLQSLGKVFGDAYTVTGTPTVADHGLIRLEVRKEGKIVKVAEWPDAAIPAIRLYGEVSEVDPDALLESGLTEWGMVPCVA